MRIALFLALLATPAHAEYLGRQSSNEFLSDSTSNQYGQYGSPYGSKSINNEFSPYGSPYGPNSANNPFSVNPPSINSDGGLYGE